MTARGAAFERLKTALESGHKYYNMKALDPRYTRLPYSVRVLAEAAVRNCNEFDITSDHVEQILAWQKTAGKAEIPFLPARVIMQDLTGVPAVVDLAAMRDAVARLGGDPRKINPLIPVELVVDHSIQVDFSGTADARERNEEMEYRRNAQRFAFLKWGSRAFERLTIVPPGFGIVHQVNLEYLARVAFANDDTGFIYPDSLVGTDSHTTMINGLGVLGWGVGGIEAESAMLGTPMTFLLPPVVGVHLKGRLRPGVTATDLVLALTQMLRKHGVVGKFAEFYGDGCATLPLADRATIANMAPEYGATCGFFPVDEKALDYLRVTGRSPTQVNYVSTYTRAAGMFATGEDKIEFTEHLEVDLSKIEACVSGPKRPQDLVKTSQLKADFQACLAAPSGHKGFGGVAPAALDAVPAHLPKLPHGAVVIAAITSCTNTSNPSVMLAAGLVARNAAARGMKVPEYVKTSLAPGSGVASLYLKNSGLLSAMESLGFNVVGFGCTTCIGNSGELLPGVSDAIKAAKSVAAAVLSGNRNFESRIHPDVSAAFLASPPLVVIYALAGTVDIDITKDPIGKDKAGNPVYLRDLWPSEAELQAAVDGHVKPALFRESYATVTQGNERWRSLAVPSDTSRYAWPDSTYIHNPPFFADMALEPAAPKPISGARVLLKLGDSVTTDHISPAGNIAKDSPAARWLGAKGVQRFDFNTYGSRRGHDEVMVRGTFANTRLGNSLIASPVPSGPVTIHFPTGKTMAVSDAAEEYGKAGTPLVILAGKEYGSGSSRDWAAKGPYLQGVRAVLAESYERIHRSNLVGMGIVPLTYKPGETAATLGLKGDETIAIDVPAAPTPRQTIRVEATAADGTKKAFEVVCRLDTKAEVAYWQHGGLLRYVIRRMLADPSHK